MQTLLLAAFWFLVIKQFRVAGFLRAVQARAPSPRRADSPASSMKLRLLAYLHAAQARRPALTQSRLAATLPRSMTPSSCPGSPRCCLAPSVRRPARPEHLSDRRQGKPLHANTHAALHRPCSSTTFFSITK